MLELPANFHGRIGTSASVFKAVVIQGTLSYKSKKSTKELRSGSYFGSSGDYDHEIELKKGQASILYIRSNGNYEILSD